MSSRRLRTCMACATAAGLLLVFGAPAASASRPASPALKATIVRDLNGRAYPVACATVYVSTVDPTWVSFAFIGSAGGTFPKSCARFGSDGITILHLEHGDWRQVTAGSSFTCPIKSYAGQPAVPRSIVRDLIVPDQPGGLRACS